MKKRPCDYSTITARVNADTKALLYSFVEQEQTRTGYKVNVGQALERLITIGYQSIKSTES